MPGDLSQQNAFAPLLLYPVLFFIQDTNIFYDANKEGFLNDCCVLAELFKMWFICLN